MATQSVSSPNISITTPVVALSFYAIASGYLMSLIPLILPIYGLESDLVGWLASTFYIGLFIGAIGVDPLVRRFGFKWAFIGCLSLYIMTIVTMVTAPNGAIWLFARFIAGLAVAGIFVVVESWLLHGEESSRAKRLGLYMASLYGGSSLGQLGIGAFAMTATLPFVIAGALLTIAIGVLFFSHNQQPNHTESSTLTLKQVTELNHAAIVGCIVSGLTLGALYGLMPLELSNRNIEPSRIGKLMAVIILGGMFVQPFIPRLSKYFGRTFLMGVFCLIGSSAIALVTLFENEYLLTTSLFALGMAVFALYPIAINLGCEKMGAEYIVSVTQVMLISYSIGSVIGPIIASSLMSNGNNLMEYLFSAFLATSIYMMLMSIKGKTHTMISS